MAVFLQTGNTKIVHARLPGKDNIQLSISNMKTKF